MIPNDRTIAILSVSRRAERPLGCCARCGAGEFRDVPIHEGRSIRRECARCGRFVGFPVWHGKE